LAPVTVLTITANAEKIEQLVQKTTKLSTSNVSYTRNVNVGKMEHLLTLWVDDLNKKRITLTQRAIGARARSLFDEIQQKEGGNETFTASKGQFARFKQHSQIHCIKISGEAASGDNQATCTFTTEIKKITEDDFPPDLVFNMDETGLYWKKLPSRSYISGEEKLVHGFKASKDQITLLLGGNASGTLKLKPLLVYHSKTPRVMKGIQKSRLPVIWTSNRKAWYTQQIFSEWYSKHFCNRVLQFCNQNNLPRKALLLLDNAPGHPPNLEDVKSELKVQTLFMPPNTTSLLQPMDQGVITTFKAYYLRQSLQEMIRQMDTSGVSLRE